MTKQILFLLILIGFLGFSCAKKPNPTPAKPSNAMAATVKGSAWTGDKFSTVSGQALGFVGIRTSDGSQVEVTFPNTITPGTYQVDPFNYLNVTWTASQTGDTYFARSGTITVSSYSDNVMVGTFSCSMTNTANNASATITNGSFTANF